MADQVLFPEPTTERTRPLGYTEPVVHFLTEVTWPEARTARHNVNDWYRNFPDGTGKFRERLQSEDNTDHTQALDELYVHHLLSRRFSDVRYEEGGVGPDFRLYMEGRCVGAVEVASLYQPGHWTRDERRYGRIADSVNTRMRPEAGYFLWLDDIRGPREPSPNDLVRFITNFVEQLPPPEQLGLSGDATRENLPSTTYTSPDGDVSIDMRFKPMRPDAPAKTDPNARMVGAGPVHVGTVTVTQRLRDRIKGKAGGRYEIEGIPYLVLVSIHDFLGDMSDALESLYGTEAVVVPRARQADDPARVIHRNNGLFGVDRTTPEGRHRRVSAVGILQDFYLRPLEKTRLSVLHNPYAANLWPRDFLTATQHFLPVEETAAGRRLDWVPGDMSDPSEDAD
jgi:hypothetical protein